MKVLSVYGFIWKRFVAFGKDYWEGRGFVFRFFLFFSFISVLFTACINEDLSNCPPKQKSIRLTYQLNLDYEAEACFTEHISSLHLGFWDTAFSLFQEQVLKGEEVLLDRPMKVTLPLAVYEHIATANCMYDGQYEPFPQDIGRMSISQPIGHGKIVKALSEAVYAGKLQLTVDCEDRDYLVLLYPVVGKVKLHLSHSVSLQNIRCYLSNAVKSYFPWQDAWEIQTGQMVDVQDFGKAVSPGQIDYVFYTFPTEVEKGIMSKVGGTCWILYVYSECNGKIIQHKFDVKQPIEAGNLFEASFRISENGGESVDIAAGVEINTDWKPGGGFEQDI